MRGRGDEVGRSELGKAACCPTGERVEEQAEGRCEGSLSVNDGGYDGGDGADGRAAGCEPNRDPENCGGEAMRCAGKLNTLGRGERAASRDGGGETVGFLRGSYEGILRRIF